MQTLDSRRKVQQSPMRASYGSAGSSGGGGAMLSSSQRGASVSSSSNNNAGFSTSKRFSTPTPQAERYTDFEVTGSRPGSASSRSGTPSKQTWKF